MLSLADEVTLHLYRLDRPEGTAVEIQVARDLLNAARFLLPISSGEWGYSTYDPSAPPDGFNFIPAVTPNRQASYLARMLLFNYSLGLRRSVIFKDRDAQNANPGNIEHHWGLMEWDLTKNPSYFAVSALTDLLGDSGPPESLPLGPGEHALRFERPDSSQVTALWAEQKATWSLRAEGSLGDAQVRGRDRTDLTPVGLSEGVQWTLEPDDGPIYLIGEISVTKGRWAPTRSYSSGCCRFGSTLAIAAGRGGILRGPSCTSPSR